MRQFEGIGPALTQKLLSAGITTIRDLRSSSASAIESAVHRNPPFGTQLSRQVSRLPDVAASLSVVDSGTRVTVRNQGTAGRGGTVHCVSACGDMLVDYRRISVE